IREKATEIKYQGGQIWTPITPIPGSILHAGSQILIFSSAEYCLRVFRLMPLTSLSAASLLVPDFLFIFAP
ncbi:hypothetical protein, partial [Ruegeria intermedia]|uniref:hypothetical protein n=1 Tax=Ruegeria intermedia TaxID=996115 RepID=UPI001CB74D87